MKTLIFSYTTRILHFLFAIFVLAAYLLSDVPSLLWLHSAFGVVAVLVVIVRIIWFFTGEQGAKISSFDLNPWSLKDYMLKYFSFKNTKLRNPAASYAAISMWTLAVLVGISGLIFIGLKYGSGLFGGFYLLNIDKHLIKEAHELFGNLLIIIAGIHVLGVMADNFLKKSGIIKTMLDGKLEIKTSNILPFKNSKFMALFIGCLVILFVAYLGIFKNNPLFNSEISHKDYKILAPNMSKECTECHVFYPPNLTSLKTQMNILDGLANHFGTDASLDSETLALIAKETKQLAPTKSGFRFEDLVNNESVTKTDRWKHEHEEFKDDWFKEHKVKKTDCKACHSNFEQGSINPFELKEK